jgi:hypothetical protein
MKDIQFFVRDPLRTGFRKVSETFCLAWLYYSEQPESAERTEKLLMLRDSLDRAKVAA